jgi:hypothetical protein
MDEEKEKEYNIWISCPDCHLNFAIDDIIDTLTEVSYTSTVAVDLQTDEHITSDEAVDYIFNELMRDGFVQNTSAIRQVLRYFYEFIMYKANYEEEEK